ncbi:MAG: TetR/AcrR family transcriptional regulator [Acidovorax sp.]
MPSESPAPSSKRTRRKEARPGELLDAALALFVEKGFAATKVEEVAARAGVSKGTLFLYFPSKLDLFKAVVRHAIAGRFDEWQVELQTFEGSTSELLRYCFHTWWERVGSTQAAGITKMVLGEAGNFPEIADFYRQEVADVGRDLIRRILQRGVDSGEFRALDAQRSVFLVLAPLMFLSMWRQMVGMCVADDGSVTPEQYIEMQVDNLLVGLLARPSQTAPLGDSAAPATPHKIQGLS